uniref:starch-binding protein n=1 Tax=uncultured Ruminococcus sp. TaxID=165186 RepID=UPI0025D18B9A|nr:starch-binding protein [uncultured Ruminococcus sp.]
MRNKKIIALVLILTTILSIFSLPASAAEKIEDQITVYYYNENNWKSPYIYYYCDNLAPVTWPGKQMNDFGDGWYSYTINNLKTAKVIFSDNGANQNPAQNQEGYSVSGEKWYLNGSWYDSEPNGITVHFNNYNDWDNVNIYYYNGNKTGTSWTGNPMIPDGDGWYTYKIYGFDEAKVLFNNGKGIQIPGQNQEGFAVSGEMWYRNGEWTSERPDDVTVYFYKPDNWSAPNIYYYKDNNDTGKAWPGNAMSFVRDNWYSYTITKYSSAKVLFNSGSNQIPPQNQPGFDVKGIVWYKDGVMCNAETDADNDGLPDYMEMVLGTNLNNKDTDSDGLLDGYEVLTLGTDPLKADTDGNGVKDSDEDADGDKLTNLEEYKLDTSPINPDTDGDGLNDYEEVYTYHTDPLNADTDGDTLSDGDDVALGFSPLLKDTDSNGILDCDEKIKQEITQEIKNEEAPQISEVQVSFEGTGNINNTTTIEDIYGKDMLSSEVVGLIGSPVEITTTSEFENATITFKYDKSRLGDTKEEDLAVMWYDEENGVYQILDNETVLDKEKQTVSYKTTHFSKYMVVDKNIWYNTWRTNIDYRVGTTTKLYYDFAFVVDTSGSMEGQRIEYAKQSMNNFVDCLTDNDNACLVSFESNAYLKARLGATKETLHTAINSLNAYGGTYVSSGLNMALNQLIASTSGNQKAIVLICDGDVDSVQSYVNIAKANNIKIFAINVISADNDILQSMADETGGEYYYAYTAEELLTAFSHISSESLFNFDLTDTDGDGLPDTFEKNGMRLANGKIVYTDPNKPDTDGDGLTDGEEMGILRRSGVLIFPSLELPFKPLFNNNMYIGKGAYSSSVLYFNNKSDPTQKELPIEEKDNNLSEEELRLLVSLQYILYDNINDDYICDNISDEISNIRRNSKISNIYNSDEVKLISHNKTTKVNCEKNEKFSVESIKQLHQRDSLILSLGGFFGPYGEVLSILGSVAKNLEQGENVDLFSLFMSISFFDKLLPKNYITLRKMIDLNNTIDIIYEDRETYKVADNFVVQKDDAFVQLLVSSNLGKENVSYFIYFRDDKVAYIKTSTAGSGDIQGSYPGYEKMIESKWKRDGYVGR